MRISWMISFHLIPRKREDAGKTMKTLSCLVVICLSGLTVATSGEEQVDMSGFFPEMDGWVRDDPPQTFTPATLYEYIDGAAEVYLSYGFEELVSSTYEGAEGQSLTIDIYRHSDRNNGFGIYSQEKPLQSTFFRIGSQGYYEPGLLNFFKDRYYVKILSFGLGVEDSSLLHPMAEEIAGRIPGEAALPEPVGCFPEKGKTKHSERYISQNFLGHGFLHSAFIAEYEIEGETLRPFIIEVADEKETAAMLAAYLKLLKKNGIEPRVENGLYRFRDPYLDQTRTMNLKRRGRYLWGLLAGNASVADGVLNAIEKKLHQQGLVR